LEHAPERCIAQALTPAVGGLHPFIRSSGWRRALPDITDERTAHTLRSPTELVGLLKGNPLLSSLSSDVIADLINACELVEVPGGTCLLRAGQSLDSFYGVVNGALRVIRRSDDGRESTVREFYRGDTLGVLGLLIDHPFPVDLYAVRDSTLLQLPRARFLSLIETHPPLFLALARVMGERAFNVLEAYVGSRRQSPTARGGNLALLPLSLGRSVVETKDSLVRALQRQRTLLHVTAELVDHALGAGSAATENGRGAEVTAWLSDQEQAADVVLYECDPRLPFWNARCRRQSDRIVIVAAAGEPRKEVLGRVMAHDGPDGMSRPIDLVLVHPPTTALPSGTKAWSALPHLRAIHHVRSGCQPDIERVVRRLVGLPTGLVLSGGGARGIAHVGVIAAIVEAGIPIDYVCGTSMGSIFAAGLALGFDISRMRAEVRELFDRPFALYDLTLPISSLLAGKKLNRVLHRQLGDGDVEDLWLPFFCVSTDLSRAKLIVHERGCLWKAVRASCSIPGIFPPLPMEGRTLVDGGLVDNLPLDLLLERCTGPIIAVDVSPYGDPGFERPSGRIAAWLRELRSRVRGEPASPPLFDILMRSTMVGSKFRQEVALTEAEQIVYLEPPVASFGALEWRAHRRLFDIGYRYAREQLVRFRSLFPSLGTH
jgi:NTE family protein/lysophospholipid hydrolase